MSISLDLSKPETMNYEQNTNRQSSNSTQMQNHEVHEAFANIITSCAECAAYAKGLEDGLRIQPEIVDLTPTSIISPPVKLASSPEKIQSVSLVSPSSSSPPLAFPNSCQEDTKNAVQIESLNAGENLSNESTSKKSATVTNSQKSSDNPSDTVRSPPKDSYAPIKVSVKFGRLTGQVTRKAPIKNLPFVFDEEEFSDMDIYESHKSQKGKKHIDLSPRISPKEISYDESWSDNADEHTQKQIQNGLSSGLQIKKERLSRTVDVLRPHSYNGYGGVNPPMEIMSDYEDDSPKMTKSKGSRRGKGARAGKSKISRKKERKSGLQTVKEGRMPCPADHKWQRNPLSCYWFDKLLKNLRASSSSATTADQVQLDLLLSQIRLCRQCANNVTLIDSDTTAIEKNHCKRICIVLPESLPIEKERKKKTKKSQLDLQQVEAFINLNGAISGIHEWRQQLLSKLKEVGKTKSTSQLRILVNVLEEDTPETIEIGSLLKSLPSSALDFVFWKSPSGSVYKSAPGFIQDIVVGAYIQGKKSTFNMEALSRTL